MADLPVPGNWQVALDMGKDHEFNATVDFIGYILKSVKYLSFIQEKAKFDETWS